MTARWTDAKIRKSDLEPYKREAEVRTLELLDDALLLARTQNISATVTEQLRASAPEDLRQLLPHLEARAEDYARDAISKLAQRGDAEAKAMREILETQRKHIEATVAKHDSPGLQMRLLEFDGEEKRQLEDNRRYWSRRLTALHAELDSEPTRIRALYEVKARRIEPVGLVYLWPTN